MLKKKKLFDYTPGRAFKSFPTFQFSAGPKDPAKMRKKLQQLSKRLDRLPEILYRINVSKEYFQ
jgi:hypothetical protein